MGTTERKKKTVTLIQCIKLKPCEQTIRCLDKEGDQQSDVDNVFRSTVLRKLTASLLLNSIYASSTPELITVQNFLQHFFKRRYVSDQINIYDVLDAIQDDLKHARPPFVSFPPQNKRKFCARSIQLPSVNTQHLKNSLLTRFFSNIK